MPVDGSQLSISMRAPISSGIGLKPPQLLAFSPQVSEEEHEGDAITCKEFMQWGCWVTRHRTVIYFW